jgi:hypothetical protein
MIAFSSSKTPSTAMPKMRKGKSSSHTMGYRTSAISASGQQKKRSTHHKRKVNIRPLPDDTAEELESFGYKEEPFPFQEISPDYVNCDYVFSMTWEEIVRKPLIINGL